MSFKPGDRLYCTCGCERFFIFVTQDNSYLVVKGEKESHIETFNINDDSYLILAEIIDTPLFKAIKE